MVVERVMVGFVLRLSCWVESVYACNRDAHGSLRLALF